MLLRNLSHNLWQGTVERSNLPALHAIQHFSHFGEFGCHILVMELGISQGTPLAEAFQRVLLVVSEGQSSAVEDLSLRNYCGRKPQSYCRTSTMASSGGPSQMDCQKQGERLLRGGNYRQQKACWWGSKSSILTLSVTHFVAIDM